jgi:transcriptional regulator with XRE-family HTH domain
VSGIKPIEQTQFYRRLRERGMTIEKLMEHTGRSRVTVTRVLNGSRRRGPVWAKIKPLLAPDEIALLDVAHCSPWNIRKVEKRPVWSPPLAKKLT